MEAQCPLDDPVAFNKYLISKFRIKIEELEVYFPYDYVYPEQVLYMKELKKSLDAQVCLFFQIRLSMLPTPFMFQNNILTEGVINLQWLCRVIFLSKQLTSDVFR